MATLTVERADARGHMLLEAADHLTMSVCETALEREEAHRLSERLRNQAGFWFHRARQIERDLNSNAA